MATTYSSLASLTPAANTLTQLYSHLTARVIVNCLMVTNNSGTADVVEVQFRPASIGGFLTANIDIIGPTAPLAANDIKKSDPFELSPGDALYVKSLNGNVSFFLTGVLVT